METQKAGKDWYNDTDISQEPISLPGSPFWNIFKRFGRDELIALFINVLGTAAAAVMFSNVWILVIAGPVVEKLGFFPAHFWEAWKIYSTTSDDERKPLRHYVRRALKGGGVSLAEDILVHDPIYIGLMIFGIGYLQGVPPWILAAVSFVIAVAAVSGLELGVTEFRYWLFKHKLTRMGFGLERYHESRFLINSSVEQQELVDCMAKEFGLSDPKQLSYADSYFDNQLPHYSGRLPKIRLRVRDRTDGSTMKTAQVVYTRADEVAPEMLDQCRYFLIAKAKLYFVLDEDASQSIDDIQNQSVKAMLKKAVKDDRAQPIRFNRMLARSAELLVSADASPDGRSFFVVEIKTHRNIRLLMKAMRFLMKRFPVIQTTRGKMEF